MYIYFITLFKIQFINSLMVFAKEFLLKQAVIIMSKLILFGIILKNWKQNKFEQFFIIIF